MAEAAEPSTADKFVAALTLTVVGGFVDAVGYISLYEIFTANMSGNSIHIGFAIVNFESGTTRRFACAVVSYVLGIILTRIAIESADRSGMRRIASLTLTLEAALLLVFARATPAMHAGRIVDQISLSYLGLVAILAFAMGVQTGTLSHLGPLTIYTTFVTGTLTKFSESFTRVLFWIYDSRNDGHSLSDIVGHLPRQKDATSSALLLGVWICYVAGAALGTIGQRHWELKALYAPVAVLAILVVLDRVRPIAAFEERKQSTGS